MEPCPFVAVEVVVDLVAIVVVEAIEHLEDKDCNIEDHMHLVAIVVVEVVVAIEH